MGKLLYFIPDPTDLLSLANLRDRGLGYAFEESPAHCRTAKGPTGGGGVVLAQGGGAFGCHPDRQAWRELPGTNGAMVGYYTDDPPKPEDLARKSQLPGHAVQLADGNHWLCPVARSWGGGNSVCSLPCKIDRHDGQWVQGGVIDRYVPLWDVACKFFDQVVALGDDDGGSFSLSETEALDGVVTILAANYRIGPEEVALLGLFDTQSAREVVFASIDWPTILDWAEQKKTEAGSAGTST